MFGGNTACVEVRGQEGPVVIDAGTGVSSLGRVLQRDHPEGGRCTVLLSHFHWDHVQGLLTFAPLFDRRWSVRFISAWPTEMLIASLQGVMRQPYFPVVWDQLPAQISYVCLPPQGMIIEGLLIRPVALHHPGSATGFRIELSGKVAVYASDHELGQPAIDAELIRQIGGADLLIHDAQYTPDEYATRQGFGHSTWSRTADFASRAGVHKLTLFHHDPLRHDECLAGIVDQTREIFANTTAAREQDVEIAGGAKE